MYKRQTSLSALDGATRWTAQYSFDELGLYPSAPRALRVAPSDGRVYVAAVVVDRALDTDEVGFAHGRLGVLSYDR